MRTKKEPVTKTTPKKRKVSRAGCKAKGAAFEKEIVRIFEEHGIPSQRVLGSGAFGNAKSDIKIGVEVQEDGSYYAEDESRGWFRIEAKNHAATPDRPFTDLAGTPFAFLFSDKDCPEQFFKHLEQDQISKAVLLRRAKVPIGAVTNKEYEKYVGVFMNIEDFISLAKAAYAKNN